MEKVKLHSKALRLFFFWIGITATFLYRAIIVINNYSYFWAQIFWYAGTVGFVIYFVHRYQISQNRVKLIKKYDLGSKLVKLEGLNPEEKNAVKYIFATLESSKEK